MRLFAAVLPPAPAIEELAAEVAQLKKLAAADRLRWAGRESWHFTLAFYGEVPEETVPDLAERLARAAHRRDPYELRIAGGGRFSDRVVWAGADGDRPAMRRLADASSAAGRRAGLTMDDEHRPYTPHLTLARNRVPGLDLRPYATALKDFTGTAWTVESLALVCSHPPVAGVAGKQPRYETVGSWPLGH
ncbi:RNA 2',3'-cyclic phosphodiesterase [Streptomyces platensis]|uniref:RNA 2',3'-cyclic phosphodiesterase n=1 Tax=Streptomyces platensis TaxID=58346 RepID=UPI002E0DDC41|nr:RNA 2',3'-cyclic phosphodiesterase [Streptomyces platensis]WSI55943.1 RNA 2',3'-cyclic phosphodiesterase [Streptomyces platensis]WTI54015.1 RNA 2',3'-cyclic phosphodiesterase [Streptomyces platensis]WUB80381.1 RNA 2',3'-cyclic phosphodiesterase [Streptomyces platensis]